MTEAPNVDYLCTRFREMSEQRDRLFMERGKTWPRSEDQSCYVNVITGSSEYNNYRRSPQRSYQRQSSVKRSVTTPVRRRTDNYKRNILDDEDRIPFAARPSRSASRNYSRNENRINRIERRPTLRWIADDGMEENQSKTVNFNFREESEPQIRRNSMPSFIVANKRPSPLLMALVNDIANRRGARSPPIPQEVIIAFETHVAHGAFMLKFVSNGAPHERFFVVKFLDRKSTFAEPEPALCWYRSAKSWTMQRYLPLADLIGVIDGGENHPAVKRRMVQAGFIKGSYVDLKPTYLRADYIVQWHFRSSGDDEEILAVKMLDRESYVSWSIVMHFFSSIGSVLAVGT
ncbi:uncharacterized protein TM35_000015470 [Trypanosoma theileri]|uniref:PH-like domain-containing protein n=1 Tax=Trypanosoma theileri TaxID=67003 RepID=A0A1X0PB46_9TRYP|nr:uncharacterized protein TM35_000015470 [Trypanosoma theileri]ORC93670.1 hypothetical protein TM35_000015470 [Trypanosoma theileri]